jgi:hypothetical protein
VDDRPAADPLAVERERLGELVEPAADAGERSGIAHQLVAAVAHERRAVEGGLADQRLGVDREPAPDLVEQHVAAVEILVQHGRLRRVGQQLAGEPRGEIEQVRLRRRPPRRLGGPAGDRVREGEERGAGRGGLRPQPPQHAGRDGVGVRLGQRPQRPGGREPLDQQRAAPGVGREQPRGPVAVPVRQGGRLVLALGLGEGDLQHRAGAVAPLGRDDERDRGRLERAPQPQLPLVGAAGGEAGERGEPRRATVHRAPPRQPFRHLHGL